MDEQMQDRMALTAARQRVQQELDRLAGMQQAVRRADRAASLPSRIVHAAREKSEGLLRFGRGAGAFAGVLIGGAPKLFSGGGRLGPGDLVRQAGGAFMKVAADNAAAMRAEARSQESSAGVMFINPPKDGRDWTLRFRNAGWLAAARARDGDRLLMHDRLAAGMEAAVEMRSAGMLAAERPDLFQPAELKALARLSGMAPDDFAAEDYRNLASIRSAAFARLAGTAPGTVQARTAMRDSWRQACRSFGTLGMDGIVWSCAAPDRELQRVLSVHLDPAERPDAAAESRLDRTAVNMLGRDVGIAVDMVESAKRELQEMRNARSLRGRVQRHMQEEIVPFRRLFEGVRDGVRVFWEGVPKLFGGDPGSRLSFGSLAKKAGLAFVEATAGATAEMRAESERQEPNAGRLFAVPPEDGRDWALRFRDAGRDAVDRAMAGERLSEAERIAAGMETAVRVRSAGMLAMDRPDVFRRGELKTLARLSGKAPERFTPEDHRALQEAWTAGFARLDGAQSGTALQDSWRRACRSYADLGLEGVVQIGAVPDREMQRILGVQLDAAERRDQDVKEFIRSSPAVQRRFSSAVAADVHGRLISFLARDPEMRRRFLDAQPRGSAAQRSRADAFAANIAAFGDNPDRLPKHVRADIGGSIAYFAASCPELQERFLQAEFGDPKDAAGMRRGAGPERPAQNAGAADASVTAVLDSAVLHAARNAGGRRNAELALPAPA